MPQEHVDFVVRFSAMFDLGGSRLTLWPNQDAGVLQASVVREKKHNGKGSSSWTGVISLASADSLESNVVPRTLARRRTSESIGGNRRANRTDRHASREFH
jgi:hypothetical protein